MAFFSHIIHRANFDEYNLKLIGTFSLLLFRRCYLDIAGLVVHIRKIRYTCNREFALKQLPDDPLANWFHSDALYPQI